MARSYQVARTFKHSHTCFWTDQEFVHNAPFAKASAYIEFTLKCPDTQTELELINTEITYEEE